MPCTDAPAQVLCTVILALAARVSDHPLLVGVSAPTLSELSVATKQGQDLSEWGRRRESACDAMTTKALQLADARGTFRTPTVESIASLLFLESLLDSASLQVQFNNSIELC